MRTLLICHDDAPLDREGLVRWLGSFSTVAGIVSIREPKRRVYKRVRREFRRVGLVRFLDVMAFRAYYLLTCAARDGDWERRQLDQLRVRFPAFPRAPVFVTASPNSEGARAFIAGCMPDLVVARCKTLLNERIFSIPPRGTYAMHPGICPEYRNAHGAFWALANGDPGKVGMTLLRVDRGVDTGPVFAYFYVDTDLASESHVITQHRAVLEHLDSIRETLTAIACGRATPLRTEGRRSATWGQPWLTAHFRTRWARASRTRRAVAFPTREGRRQRG